MERPAAPYLSNDEYARQTKWTSWFLAVAFTSFGWLVIAACLIVLMAVGTALFYLWPILLLGIIGYLVVRHKKKQAGPDAPRLTIDVEPHGAATVLVMHGRLDGTTVAIFDNVVSDLLADGKTTMIVDCTDLAYISSAGLRVHPYGRPVGPKGQRSRVALQSAGPHSGNLHD